MMKRRSNEEVKEPYLKTKKILFKIIFHNSLRNEKR